MIRSTHRPFRSVIGSLPAAITVLAACLLPPAAPGQPRPAAAGADAYGYTVFDGDDAECGYQFVDIAGSGIPVPLTASGAEPARDDGGAVVALAESFEFYGRALTGLVLSSNGYLGAASSLLEEDGGDFSNDPHLPAIPGYLPAIPGGDAAVIGRLLAFHDELSGEAVGGDIRVQHFAVCPRPSGAVAAESCTVLQWSGWGFLGSPGSFDLQAVLYHTSFAIAFQIDLGGLSQVGATIGIQDFEASTAAQYFPAAPLTGTVAVCLFEPRFPAGGLEADLSITKSDKTDSLVGATEVTYEIVARNAGPSPVVGAAVSDPILAPLENCTWTCTAAAGSSCTASGTGDIADGVDLLAGGWVAYSLTCDIPAGASGSVVNTASVAAPPGVTDPDPTNDVAGDSDPVPVELVSFAVE